MANYRIHDFKVASKVGNDISEFTDIESKAPSDRCSMPGIDMVYSKCYALQELSINPYQAINERYNVNGVRGVMNFDDVDIERGFNAVLFWLKFNDDPATRNINDPIIIEVGIIDITGDGEPKFTCVEGGYAVSYTFETTPMNNTNYNFTMEEQRNGDWHLTINGEHCHTLDDIPQHVYPKVFIRGTETSTNNISDFTQEFNNMRMKWENGWYYLQPFFGTDQRTEVKKEFFIDLCGIGIENMYQIETGKKVARNC